MGYVWLLIAVLATGLWFVLLKRASLGVAPVLVQSVYLLGMIAGTLTLLAGYWLWGQVRSAPSPWHVGPAWYLAVFAGALICLPNVCMFQAYQTLPVWVVAPLINLSCVVPLAVMVATGQERVNRWQVLGVVLAVAAIALMVYPYKERAPAP